MGTHRSANLLRDLRALYDAGVAAGLTDAQLLERFNNRRAEALEADAAAEAAFAALVARHGPMVLGVCRRALSDPCDVEDAFQATFLILVRKAPTVRVHDSLGRWLYGVARRVAARAWAVARRRESVTTPLPDDLVSHPGASPDRMELATILDDELARLPARYRLPLTMCYLAGMSNEEAARLLGCPLGTLQSRLSRGRDRLRDRLRRRGLTPSDDVSWTSAAFGGVRPSVPAAWSQNAVRAAMRLVAGKGCGTGAIPLRIAALTEGVIRAMTLARLRSAVVIVVFLVAGSMTAAGVLHHGDGRGPTAEGASAATVALGGSPTYRDDAETPEDPSAHLKPLEPMLGDWDFGAPDRPEKPLRAIFQWKGNRSCIGFRTFARDGGDWKVISTGLIFWDPVARAIRETGFDESPDLFQNGTWKPERDRLVGEFVDYEGGAARKSHFVIRFVDRDTMEMTGNHELEFKRSRRGEVPPSGRAESVRITAARVPGNGAGRGRTDERASAAAVTRETALVAHDAERMSEDPAAHLKPLEALLGDWDVGFANNPTTPFRLVFQWKGNRSCVAYRSFVRQEDGWAVMGTGLFFWDPATRAIRETSFDESPDLFQNGRWKPEPGRLVGEFVDYNEDGTRRKSHLVIRFVDRDTLEMRGERQLDFKRSRQREALAGDGARHGETLTLRPYPASAPDH